MHEQGELATARAAGAAGTIMTVSTVSNFSIEEIAEVATGPLWFQLYFLKDREVTRELIKRAEASGYKALVLTVDNVAGRLSAEVRRQLDPNWGPAARRSKTLDPDRLLRNLADLTLTSAFRAKDQLATGWTTLCPGPILIGCDRRRLCPSSSRASRLAKTHASPSSMGRPRLPSQTMAAFPWKWKDCRPPSMRYPK